MADNRAAALADQRNAVRQVLAEYYDAFSRDPTAASAFYNEPAMIVLPDGVFGLGTRAEVGAFFAKALTSLKPTGYLKTTLGDCRIKLLNPTIAICSAIARRVKAGGAELGEYGFTYTLHKGTSGWKIVAMAATDLDKLVNED